MLTTLTQAVCSNGNRKNEDKILWGENNSEKLSFPYMECDSFSTIKDFYFWRKSKIAELRAITPKRNGIL